MSGRDVLGIALAYGLGCLCAGYYVVRWRTGADIRRIGSSSAGARNAGRVLGRWGFALVLALDALKGVAAVWAACAIGLGGAAVAVVAGHVVPVQLGFRAERASSLPSAPSSSTTRGSCSRRRWPSVSHTSIAPAWSSRSS